MTLHCAATGAGRDLVLLHGWGANAAVWKETARELARRFRVHCVDLPGNGGSSSCAPYTLDAVTDVLANALPHSVAVCGWSLGGQLALNWALRHPVQVRCLVLIATTPRFVRSAEWKWGIATGVFDTFAHGLARDCRATLQRFIALQARGDTDARTVMRRLRAPNRARGKPDISVLAAGLQMLKETDLRARLPQIAQRVLLLHGDRDTLVPLAAGQRLQQALPRAVLETIEGAAHAPFVAQPLRVARRVAEFCSDG